MHFVSYTFGGKKHRIETDKPEFSRLADRPGIFEMHSVSHRKAAHVSKVPSIIVTVAPRLISLPNQCETRLDDMRATVHPLPSAHIQEGDSWLHEGV